MSLASLLLPVQCPRCGRSGTAPCLQCVDAATVAPVLSCPFGVDDCRAAFLYDGVGRSFIAPLKYGGNRTLVPWLVQCLAALTAEVSAVARPPFDVITWVPATNPNRRRRGFDQGQLLARGLAIDRGLPLKRLLRRGDPISQTGRSRGERLAGPELVAAGLITGHVLIVDDVITTGASMSSAAQVLRRAGADRITAIAAAYTPTGR